MLKSRTRQLDVVEWFRNQHSPLKTLRKQRNDLEKGFIAYGKDFRDFFAEMRENRRKKKSMTKEDKEAEEKKNAESSGSQALQQYYQSQELLKKMKWKRVSWEATADYETFSRRLLDNDTVFSSCSAFSFMSIHVVKDPSTTDVLQSVSRSDFNAGDITNWLLRERDGGTSVAKFSSKEGSRSPPFVVDWVSGEAKILDTASAQEILIFLETIAPRLQALQVRMEQEQTELTADAEKVRVRLGLTSLKFNINDTSFWDDPKRISNLDYVDPAQLRKFLDSALRSALLYRRFLKGQQVRIVPAGRPYFIDWEKKELQIPANFADYNWLVVHDRLASFEKVLNACRATWWLWFCVAMLLVGDLEVI